MEKEKQHSEGCSISTQTEWSWLEDLKTTGRESVPLPQEVDCHTETSCSINGEDSSREELGSHESEPQISTKNGGLKSMKAPMPKESHEPQDKPSEDKNQLHNPHSDMHTPVHILDDGPSTDHIFSDSDSDSSYFESDYDDETLFPSVGPPQMLELLKRHSKRKIKNEGDELDNIPFDTEGGFHKSFFSGPCQFCGQGVLPLPTVQEIETLPNNQLFCCSQYEEFVKLYITYVDKKKVEAEVIDIKPHAPYGTKAARKAAKERAAERMREKEIEKQKAVAAQANFFSFARQVKTIQYALSSIKCMQDGWTIRPLTPPVEPIKKDDDEFSIDVNTSLLQKKNELYEKFYESGKRFLVIFPDGTGCCYYPSGNVAVMITSYDIGKYTYILQQDSEDFDTEDPGILAVFEPKGNAGCYHKDGSLRLMLTAYGGMQLDKLGNYKKKWNWHFIKGHVHTPPFQPICFALNKQLSCRVMEQDHIVVTFTSEQRAVRFNVGAKLKAIKQAIPPIPKKSEHQQFLEMTKKKVQHIQDKIQLTMKFPKSPKLETLVGKTQKSSDRKSLPNGKLQLPKIKGKEPSVVVN